MMKTYEIMIYDHLKDRIFIRNYMRGEKADEERAPTDKSLLS
jgi:hypothetical protein